MKRHSSSELRYTAQILGPDGVTVRASGISVGVEDLSGRRLEQAQLINSETSHMILAQRGDVGGILDSSCYIVCDGVTYIVDYPKDPRVPRPNMWTEIYCHVEGMLTVRAVYDGFWFENGVDILLLEDGSSTLLLET